MKTKLSNGLNNRLVINSIFFVVLVIFLASMFRYWHLDLNPRLRAAALTQAEIISQSQKGILLRALEFKQVGKRKRAVQEAIGTILLVTDPSINEPFIKSVGLQIDYDTVDSPLGSLDIVEGVIECKTCFDTEVALIAASGELLAIATFKVTDAYYKLLSSDLKSKLINQSVLILFLFLCVMMGVLALMRRLQKLNDKIELSDRAKTQFMANMSHELRTPLNAILGYTQLYKKDKSIMQAHEQGINTIHKSADHLLMLINDILDFSKVDSQGVKLQKQEVILTDLFTTLVEMTAVRATINLVDFKFEFSKNLPVVVLADGKRLRQVLLNLLNNAVKFSAKGSVVFKVATLSRDASNLFIVKFSVADTGIGIHKSKLEEIFIPYQQVENTITQSEGSGLGLTISRSLVELMGGELKVKSELGVGSEFYFELLLPTVDTIDSIVKAIKEPPKNILVAPPLAEMVLPSQSVIDELKEGASKHNILKVRKILTSLDQEMNFMPFVEALKPLAQEYQFSGILDVLAQLESNS